MNNLQFYQNHSGSGCFPLPHELGRNTALHQLLTCQQHNPGLSTTLVLDYSITNQLVWKFYNYTSCVFVFYANARPVWLILQFLDCLLAEPWPTRLQVPTNPDLSPAYHLSITMKINLFNLQAVSGLCIWFHKVSAVTHVQSLWGFILITVTYHFSTPKNILSYILYRTEYRTVSSCIFISCSCVVFPPVVLWSSPVYFPSTPALHLPL